jgi:hypothetical protein
VKTNRPALFVTTTVLLTLAIAQPARLSAESAAQWTVQVSKVNPGAVGLTPSFQVAIYENLLQELSKTKRFNGVLRDGDQKAANATDLLLLNTVVEKYTAGSETRRAVTTVTGATKLIVHTQLSTPDGKIILTVMSVSWAATCERHTTSLATSRRQSKNHPCQSLRRPLSLRP